MENNKISFVYFVECSEFNNEYFKLIITNVNEEEIIISHRNVYSEMNDNPIVTIIDKIIVFDRFTLQTSLQRLKNEKVNDGFYKKTNIQIIKKFIEVINNLIKEFRGPLQENGENSPYNRLEIPQNDELINKDNDKYISICDINLVDAADLDFTK